MADQSSGLVPFTPLSTRSMHAAGVDLRGADYTNPDPDSGRTTVATPGLIVDPDESTPAFIQLNSADDAAIRDSQLEKPVYGGGMVQGAALVKSGGAARRGVEVVPHDQMALKVGTQDVAKKAAHVLKTISVDAGNVSFDVQIKGLFQNETGTVITLQIPKGPRPVKFPISGEEQLPLTFTLEDSEPFTAFYTGFNFDVPDGGHVSVFYVFIATQ